MERNLMVAGFGGQGVMTLGKFLAEAACDSTDKNVTFFPSYGAEQRGGTANCSIVKSAVSREDVKVVRVPVTEMALDMGSAKVLNIIMLGAYVGYTQVVPEDVVWQTIEHKLGRKPKLLPLNKRAFEAGLDIGRAAR